MCFSTDQYHLPKSVEDSIKEEGNARWVELFDTQMDMYKSIYGDKLVTRAQSIPIGYETV